MRPTTIKVSPATRDRIKARGGSTHEATIVEALDALDQLDEERFWAQAEQAKRDFDALPKAAREHIRAEYNRIDAAYRGAR